MLSFKYLPNIFEYFLVLPVSHVRGAFGYFREFFFPNSIKAYQD
ncbi:hypothetical protein WM42_2087 [Corynebacterium simulans]|uniref:Uncharacterized protein n=1 Tax=Corynebacterium simulans TaxID=146827 RepID=A0ABR5V7K9_9CORY|nr:hypothetical protein WM42_2087 [Corynebacterium simulans]KXU17524.1 hypothetical protein WM41_1793 [Corynebacterium simulans]